MAIDKHIRRGHPILLGSIVVFSIIEMCISAWITAKYNSHHNFRDSGVRARIRYVLFVSVWTTIFGSVYIAAFLAMTGSLLASVLSHFLFLTITWILWLAAAAALTQTLGGALNCSTQTEFVYCGQLSALMGFAWLIWVVVTFALLFVLIRGIRSAKVGDGYNAPLIEV